MLLPERDVYVQRIPKSDSVLTIGPVDYLFFARKLNWIDVLAVLSLTLALGVPAFLWLRPLVRHARVVGGVTATGPRAFSAALICQRRHLWLIWHKPLTTWRAVWVKWCKPEKR